jgi:hypothetical protein
VSIDPPKTIADGARTLAIGVRNFEIIRALVKDVVSVDDDVLLESLKWAMYARSWSSSRPAPRACGADQRQDSPARTRRGDRFGRKPRFFAAGVVSKSQSRKVSKSPGPHLFETLRLCDFETPRARGAHDKLRNR